MRIKYDTELENLNLDMIRAGAIVEETIEKVIRMIETADAEIAKSVIAEDDVVDEITRQIESRSMKLIMRQQPVAKDLRAISTALKMITDIERIADLASDICEIFLQITKNNSVRQSKNIPIMGAKTAQMVHMAIESFVRLDVELAQKVVNLDNEVDKMYDIIKKDLLSEAIADSTRIDKTVDYLMIAKYFERIGDHAENIAEWAMFSVTGIHKDQRIL